MTSRTACLAAGAAGLLLAASACSVGRRERVTREDAPPLSTIQPVPQAMSLVVADAAQFSEGRSPEPSADLPCGAVDRLDFPVGPPDGDGFGARWIFGRNSRRYRQIHAGEDWTAVSGASLGKPVHAIGHGLVTYANPYGWGATDKGVVIVRHRLPDGADRLSLYGHLEPSSINLQKGACVARGDVVGRVGKPRGAPHLHFEIRSHLPDQPGPGYWPTDPTRAGWDPPTETILTWRDRLHPSVAGVIPMTNAVAIGALGGDILVAHDGQVIALAIDTASESATESWRSAGGLTTLQPILDAARGLLYIIRDDPNGRMLTALRVPPDGPEPLWTSIVPGDVSDAVGGPPETGGVIVLGKGWMRRYGPGGDYLETAVPEQSASMVAVGGHTVVSSQDPAGGSWVVDPNGSLRGPLLPGGIAAAAGSDGVWLLRPEGLYRADLATLHARRVAVLDGGPFRSGAITALGDGGALALRRGQGAWELVRALPSGAISWRRTLERNEVQQPELLLAGGIPHVVTRGGDLLRVDAQSGEAIRMYRAARDGASARASSAGDRILLEAGGAYSIAILPPGDLLDAALD